MVIIVITTVGDHFLRDYDAIILVYLSNLVVEIYVGKVFMGSVSSQ